ncbi:MAG: YdcH family protein [Marivivens sp.]|nr:YdcH family protein [Marivivens sp.]
MSHTPHELAEDFPDKRELIHDLKTSDAHFAQIAEKYHELNRTVHRAETNVEPVDGLYMSELRKERMALKDEIARMLNDEIHARK